MFGLLIWSLVLLCVYFGAGKGWAFGYIILSIGFCLFVSTKSAAEVNEIKTKTVTTVSSAAASVKDGAEKLGQ